MCCEPVTRIEYDILDDVVRAMLGSPEDAYWPRRLLDLVRDPVAANRLQPYLVIAVGRWAAHDPSFFVHEHYLAEQLAVWAWPREVIEELDAKLRLADASLTHLVMGRLWLAARRPQEDLPECYARAAAHLREVEARLQVGAYHEALCEALGVADPDELARRADEILEAAVPASRERVRLAILRGAARAGNWDLYDAQREHYASLDRGGQPRLDSEVMRLDGSRAEQRLIHPPPRRRVTELPPSLPLAEPEPAEGRHPSGASTRSSRTIPSLARLLEATTARPPSRG